MDGCVGLASRGSDNRRRWVDSLVESKKKETEWSVDGGGDFLCSPESLSIWRKVDARGREEFKK